MATSLFFVALRGPAWHRVGGPKNGKMPLKWQRKSDFGARKTQKNRLFPRYFAFLPVGRHKIGNFARGCVAQPNMHYFGRKRKFCLQASAAKSDQKRKNGSANGSAILASAGPLFSDLHRQKFCSKSSQAVRDPRSSSTVAERFAGRPRFAEFCCSPPRMW
jgi:hypothetical protein